MVKIAETYKGKPCLHGHGDRRYISTGRCVMCISISGKLAYQRKKAGHVPKRSKHVHHK